MPLDHFVSFVTISNTLVQVQTPPSTDLERLASADRDHGDSRGWSSDYSLKLLSFLKALGNRSMLAFALIRVN